MSGSLDGRRWGSTPHPGAWSREPDRYDRGGGSDVAGKPQSDY